MHKPGFFLLAAALSLSTAFASAESDAPRTATLVVATHDSAESSKASADYVGDGEGDQEEIRKAILALPPVGGTVLLMEGTYDIRRVEGQLGGVIIDRSHVTLAGQGTATKLVLAPKQDTNVIRIIGSDVGYITIRDLYVDANRDENPDGKGDPNVSHGRFEFCGIKAFYTYPGGPTGKRNHHITIRDAEVHDSHRLGIMLEGSNMKVINNVLGNAHSDAVEILTGPGEIRGNYVEITGRTHVAIGTDRGDNILMTDNIVHVKETGDLDIGFRSWANSHRHVIANNVLTVDKGGICRLAIDARGYEAVITGNNIQDSNEAATMRLRVGGGNSIVTDNILENCAIEINDTTEKQLPIRVNNNILIRSVIDHKKGQLITE